VGNDLHVGHSEPTMSGIMLTEAGPPDAINSNA
jgi:hypothetical protein